MTPRLETGGNGSDGGLQAAVVAFLSQPESYGAGASEVTRLDTHISSVFLVGDRAYKLKRAVDFGYLDYTDPAERHRLCLEEVARNRRTAPEIYLGVVAVTRDDSGRLALDGAGTAVDWLVVMRRFDQDALFDRMAQRGALEDRHLIELADEIARFHGVAERCAGGGGDAFRRSVDSNAKNVMDRVPDTLAVRPATRFVAACERALMRAGGVLDGRARDGFVRRCHGDLHLRNICLFEGKPTLFDCIEFNDTLSDIDVLYDLAFLLMDLEHRGLRSAANLVFNRYVAMTGDSGGLIALPLFLALRAGIRAHVGAAAADIQTDPVERDRQRAESSAYLDLGLEFLHPKPPLLVAIGGLSGTGKSVLARALAPGLGPRPGALHLSSDVMRKRLFGLAPEAPLDSEAYRPEISDKVYGALREGAAAALAGGHAVVVDATHTVAAARDALSAVAAQARVPFVGLWLDAAPEVLEARIVARTGDASDADLAVLRDQLGGDPGPIAWTRIAADGNAAETLALARAALTVAIE